MRDILRKARNGLTTEDIQAQLHHRGIHLRNLSATLRRLPGLRREQPDGPRYRIRWFLLDEDF